MVALPEITEKSRPTLRLVEQTKPALAGQPTEANVDQIDPGVELRQSEMNLLLHLNLECHVDFSDELIGYVRTELRAQKEAGYPKNRASEPLTAATQLALSQIKRQYGRQEEDFRRQDAAQKIAALFGQATETRSIYFPQTDKEKTAMETRAAALLVSFFRGEFDNQ